MKCFNKDCERYSEVQEDGTNCSKWFLQNLRDGKCGIFVWAPPEPTPEERLPLDPKELSTEDLAVVILDRNVSLWYRKEALTEYDTREGRI